MELPLARAASQQDVVVRIDTSFRLDGPGEDPIHMPFHVLFLPAPGVLNRVVELLGARRIGEHRLPVRMGELVVSRRPGDVLVASALGSCVAIALVDRLAGVATMAHVMLPESPDSSPGSLRGVPLFSARYANLAVPSLILALEQAGGRRVCCQAYLAGGGQMFTGSLAEAMDVPQRNLAAARAALAMHGIAIRGEETGGALSRSMEVDVASGSVTVKNTGRDVRRLDQAA